MVAGGWGEPNGGGGAAEEAASPAGGGSDAEHGEEERPGAAVDCVVCGDKSSGKHYGSPTLSARAALMSLPASFPCPSPRLCFAQVQKREGCGAGPRSASSAFSSSAAPGTRCPRSPPRLPGAERFLPGPVPVPQKPLGDTPPLQPEPPALRAARRGRGAEGRRRRHTCARARRRRDRAGTADRRPRIRFKTHTRVLQSF